MVRVTKEDLVSAKQSTDAGRADFAEGKAKIDQIVTNVNNGQIGGAVSQEILAVKESIEPLLKKAQSFFDQIDEVMLKANKEYDNTTDEAHAAINKNRL